MAPQHGTRAGGAEARSHVHSPSGGDGWGAGGAAASHAEPRGAFRRRLGMSWAGSLGMSEDESSLRSFPSSPALFLPLLKLQPAAPAPHQVLQKAFSFPARGCSSVMAWGLPDSPGQSRVKPRMSRSRRKGGKLWRRSCKTFHASRRQWISPNKTKPE